MRMRGPYFVYFIAPVGGGLVKIGLSQKPVARLETLAAWCPIDLEFLAVVPAIPGDELHLHYMFREHYVRHEWFRPVPELLAVAEWARLTSELPPHAKWTKTVRYRDIPFRARQNRTPESRRRQGEAMRETWARKRGSA